MEFILGVIVFIIVFIMLPSLKQINEYERGVKFTLGKYSKMMEPGWRLVFPIFQSYKKVDVRTKVDDVPEQEAITKDNVSVKINAVIYYKVFDASLAVLAVEDFYYATAQLAQTTMRNIVGSVTLDELLSEREKVSGAIKDIIDAETDPWGIKISVLAPRIGKGEDSYWLRVNGRSVQVPANDRYFELALPFAECLVNEISARHFAADYIDTIEVYDPKTNPHPVEKIV